MILYPAIDLRGGNVVRLKEGDPARQTVFSDNPVEMAQRWIGEGAEWLHIVNLDGSFGDSGSINLDMLEKIAALGTPIEFGGGLRDLSSMQRAVDAGAARLVLGTVAVKQPEIVATAAETFGSEAICVGLDSKNGVVVTHGWQQATEITPAELGKTLAGYGAKYALFTDVSRDGLLEGVNVEATETLAKETGLEVIASGGVSSLDDVRRLTSGGIVNGAVIGMALYTGAFTLREALEMAGEPQAPSRKLQGTD